MAKTILMCVCGCFLFLNEIGEPLFVKKNTCIIEDMWLVLQSDLNVVSFA
jgi:hypothetical protein